MNNFFDNFLMAAVIVIVITQIFFKAFNKK